jgi:hypothetical protein
MSNRGFRVPEPGIYVFNPRKLYILAPGNLPMIRWQIAGLGQAAGKLRM